MEIFFHSTICLHMTAHAPMSTFLLLIANHENRRNNELPNEIINCISCGRSTAYRIARVSSPSLLLLPLPLLLQLLFLFPPLSIPYLASASSNSRIYSLTFNQPRGLCRIKISPRKNIAGPTPLPLQNHLNLFGFRASYFTFVNARSDSMNRTYMICELT